MEIIAAGIEVANGRPALRPKYTLAAVNSSVMRKPSTTPRRVSSRVDGTAAFKKPPGIRSRIIADAGPCAPARPLGFPLISPLDLFIAGSHNHAQATPPPRSGLPQRIGDNHAEVR